MLTWSRTAQEKLNGKRSCHLGSERPPVQQQRALLYLFKHRPHLQGLGQIPERKTSFSAKVSVHTPQDTSWRVFVSPHFSNWWRLGEPTHTRGLCGGMHFLRKFKAYSQKTGRLPNDKTNPDDILAGCQAFTNDSCNFFLECSLFELFHHLRYWDVSTFLHFQQALTFYPASMSIDKIETLHKAKGAGARVCYLLLITISFLIPCLN